MRYIAAFLIGIVLVGSGCDSGKLGQYKLSGHSPWCAVEPEQLMLRCEYFSEEHCARTEMGILPSPQERRPKSFATCVRNPLDD
jgi:hypothetical protein